MAQISPSPLLSLPKGLSLQGEGELNAPWTIQDDYKVFPNHIIW